jgi:hypothetical protein
MGDGHRSEKLAADGVVDMPCVQVRASVIPSTSYLRGSVFRVFVCRNGAVLFATGGTDKIPSL